MLLRLMSGLITTRPFLNIASGIMGFFLWYTISQAQVLTHTMALPVYFDNLSPEQSIQAPEKLEITLRANQATLRMCKYSGALHINAQTLPAGTHLFFPHKENFLLPNNAQIVTYQPIKIHLEVSTTT